MTLNDFHAEVRAWADDFENHWLLMREQDGDHDWPLDMDQVDWVEQFVVWLDGIK